jgi:hypothetical protein
MTSSHDRAFIRHAAAIPLEVEPYDACVPYHLQLNNVSVGGLSFDSPVALSKGALVKIAINITLPVFNVDAVVQWCKSRADHYEAGVEFLGEEDAFRVRMMEQVCHIEQYHQLQSRLGRKLSKNEAAQEWINQNAANFPY